MLISGLCSARSTSWKKRDRVECHGEDRLGGQHFECPSGGENQPTTDAGGIQLAHATRHSRTAVVPASSICGALHLCAPGTAWSYGSSGEWRLENCASAGCAAGGGRREKHTPAARGES